MISAEILRSWIVIGWVAWFLIGITCVVVQLSGIFYIDWSSAILLSSLIIASTMTLRYAEEPVGR